MPAADGIEFNPSSRAFDWTETVHREEFRMRAGQATAGRIIRGRLTVYLGAIVVAEIGMALRVEATASAATAESASDHARPYRKVFASYSHHDSAIVEEFAEYARAMGDKYLRDVIDLRSGEQWQPALEQLIQDADVFQLFWSWNAIESPYVRQEWVYALSLKRRSFVRPVYGPSLSRSAREYRRHRCGSSTSSGFILDGSLLPRGPIFQAWPNGRGRRKRRPRFPARDRFPNRCGASCPLSRPRRCSPSFSRQFLFFR